jgi:hypothetical protein
MHVHPMSVNIMSAQGEAGMARDAYGRRSKRPITG